MYDIYKEKTLYYFIALHLKQQNQQDEKSKRHFEDACGRYDIQHTHIHSGASLYLSMYLGVFPYVY